MIKSYQYLDIDINKKTYRRLRAVQGDSKSRYILVSLYDNSKAYNLSNCSVKVFGCKSDKNIFFNYAIVTDVINGKFEIELTNQALAVAGELEIQILILGTNQERLTSFSFYIDVEKSIVNDGVIESANEFKALTGALSQVEEWNGYFEETSGKIEEKYTERLNNFDSQLKRIVDVYDNSTTLTNFINTSKSNIIEVITYVNEDDIIINRNDVELVLKADVKTNSLTINGNNSGITFKGGKLIGDLLTCKTTRVTPANSNVLYFDDGHPFKVGDLVASSYGLGGDGKNHAVVTICDTYCITVDRNTSNDLPIGTDIGNYTWSGLLNLTGSNNYVNNLSIENSRGYSLTSVNNTIINNGYLQNCGLDVALLKNGHVTLNNVNVGNVIDCGKSGFVLQGCTIVMNDCIVNKNNSDADFVIYDSEFKSNIYANRCEFYSENTHPTPFDYKKFALISIQSQRNGIVVGDIVFDNCKMHESIHGIFYKENDSFKPTVYNISINNCLINDCLGEMRYFDIHNCNINNCDIFDVEFENKSFVLNNSLNLNVNNTKFTNIKCDFGLAFNVNNCTFTESYLKVVNDFRYKGVELINSTIVCANSYENNKVMVIEDLLINDTQFQVLNMSGDVSSSISLNKDNTVLKFKYPNSNSEYFIYNHVGRTFYNSKMLTAFGKIPNFTKYDYIIGNDSIFYDVSSYTSKKIINSELKIKQSVEDNKIYIDTSRLSIGDKVNVLTFDSTVFTYNITDIQSGYIVCDSNVAQNIHDEICVYRLNS